MHVLPVLQLCVRRHFFAPPKHWRTYQSLVQPYVTAEGQVRAIQYTVHAVCGRHEQVVTSQGRSATATAVHAGVSSRHSKKVLPCTDAAHNTAHVGTTRTCLLRLSSISIHWLAAAATRIPYTLCCAWLPCCVLCTWCVLPRPHTLWHFILFHMLPAGCHV